MSGHGTNCGYYDPEVGCNCGFAERGALATVAEKLAALTAERDELRQKLEEAEQNALLGNSACRMIAELVDLIPPGRMIVSSKSGNVLVNYLRGIQQRADSAEAKLAAVREKCEEGNSEPFRAPQYILDIHQLAGGKS